MKPAPDVVTVDFDDTLLFQQEHPTWGRVDGQANKALISSLRYLASTGSTIYVVTRRCRELEGVGAPRGHPAYRMSIKEFVKRNRVPIEGVYFTCGRWKARTIARVRSRLHFDDDRRELALISRISPQTSTVLV